MAAIMRPSMLTFVTDNVLLCDCHFANMIRFTRVIYVRVLDFLKTSTLTLSFWSAIEHRNKL